MHLENMEKLPSQIEEILKHKEKFKKIDIYNPRKKVLGDVFVTVKFLDNKKIHGYAKLNKAMAEYFNQLIEFREESASINIIQWTDRFLMVFEDSMHISYRYAFLETEDALDFFKIYFAAINSSSAFFALSTFFENLGSDSIIPTVGGRS